MYIFRILIGLVFLVSGAEKLIAPYQNFVYVIQAYQIVPHMLENVIARVFPWIELLAGLFLVLGLWTSWALRVAVFMTGSFIMIVGQALVRQLPLEQCGCFGSLIHVPPQAIIVFDSAMLLVIMVLLRLLSKTSRFSLDKYFDR